ncbi:MAG: amidohydrolase [Desulfurivibrionaceae bacterium]
MNPEILITNCLLMPDGTEAEFISDQYVHIEGDTVRQTGPVSEVPEGREAEIIDARGSLVMPGLVNCHNHSAMTLFRGMADDLELSTWLEEYIFPSEARFLDEETVYWCTKLAAAEMITSGTTTVADGYFFEDSAALAFEDSGIRAVAAQGIVDFPAPGVADPAENLVVAGNFLDRWQGRERITPALFAHSPYTCGARTLEKGKETAESRQAPFFIHLAETSEEVSRLQEQTGFSPVHYLDHLGILDSRTVCVHCVAVNDRDIEILAARKAGVVTCPESNMKLAGGTAPVPDLLAKGIAVGLGTDSPASNNNCDMFREMDSLAKLQKVSRLDPTVMSASEVLRIATTGGARVLGMEGPAAGLAPGSRADLVIVDLERANLVPFLNKSSLVYSAGAADVSTSIINGRIVMRDRNILAFDCLEAMSEVRRLAEKAMS